MSSVKPSQWWFSTHLRLLLLNQQTIRGAGRVGVGLQNAVGVDAARRAVCAHQAGNVDRPRLHAASLHVQHMSVCIISACNGGIQLDLVARTGDKPKGGAAAQWPPTPPGQGAFSTDQP